MAATMIAAVVPAELSPGSVAFFGLDPLAHDVEKDIAVVYNGIAYYPSTIKFAPNNASWRIQLKGNAEIGDGSLSQFGRTDFANHILIFHRLTSDHYILETMAESELDAPMKPQQPCRTAGLQPAITRSCRSNLGAGSYACAFLKELRTMSSSALVSPYN